MFKKFNKTSMVLTLLTLLLSFNALSQSYESYVAQDEVCLDLITSIKEIRTVSATYEASVKALFFVRPGATSIHAGQLHSNQAFINHINSINGLNLEESKHTDNFGNTEYDPNIVFGYSYKADLDSDKSAVYSLPSDTKEFTFAVRNPESPRICHCVFAEERSQLSCDSWQGDYDKIQAEYEARMQDHIRLKNTYSKVRFFNSEAEHEKRLKMQKIDKP
ncbi:hypothetical protein MRY82_03240 [bacterium]|nr:hypothetical protein [bacterium]